MVIDLKIESVDGFFGLEQKPLLSDYCNYLLIKNYSKTIKKQQILSNIHIEFEDGKCYGITGYKGCGKTMLLRAICGYIKPDG